MKITAINGSPHSNGQTSQLLDIILAEAGGRKHSYEKFDLGPLTISGCKGCFSCKKNGGTCVQNDDMKPIYESINGSDILILGTPLYMWQMTGQSKIFTDRLMPYFRNGEKSGKRAAFAVTYKGSAPAAVKEYFDFSARMFEHLGFPVIGTVSAGKTDQNPVATRDDLKTDIAGLVSRF